jgi:hypothetical protein
MPDRVISRAEFARLARVSKPAITKWLGKHPAACDGDRVRLDHPDVGAYLTSKGVAPPAPPPAAVPAAGASAPAPTKSRKPPKAAPAKPTASSKGAKRQPAAPTTPPPPPESPPARKGRRHKDRAVPEPDEATGFVDELADRTLLQICEEFGTIRKFKDHLEAFEKRERALKYRLENEEAEGRLIAREVVVRVIGAFDGAFRKLLGDGPKTISRRVYAMARSGQTNEEAEATVHEILSTILKSVKRAARDVIDDG